MPSYVVKAAPPAAGGAHLMFDEKTMWRGRDIRAGDEVFLFAAEHNGGHGLYACGVAIAAVRGTGSRVSLTVQCTARSARPLGRSHLKPIPDRTDSSPQAEIAHKLYRQATNKIAGISDAAAAFLRGFF